jgi:hypothetical protein
MRRIISGILFSAMLLCLSLPSAGATDASAELKNNLPNAAAADRAFWVELMCRMAEPVLENMSRGELKKNMQVEFSPTWDGRNGEVAYMETFGRLMAGIAPWFNLPDDDTPEGRRRAQLRRMALESYANAVDPDSPDCLMWEGHSQILVDAAYIAESFVRAPALWEALGQTTRERYIERFEGVRSIQPAYNNWLLFRGMVEAFLLSIGEKHDGFALSLAVRKMDEWYLGDGWYGDGPEFSLDYYNGYVIHPMLVEITEIMESKKIHPAVGFDLALRRMQRYNRLLERLISPEATYPAMGRSVTYRMGAFQTLALSAWKYGLPEPLTPGAVRNSLTSVMRRMFADGRNFNDKGWLQLGFVGELPDLADYYTNTGSLYMTSLVFMPLGLPAGHEFWSAPDEKWTSQRAWDGEPFPKDYHESVKR